MTDSELLRLERIVETMPDLNLEWAKNRFQVVYYDERLNVNQVVANGAEHWMRYLAALSPAVVRELLRLARSAA